MSLGTLTFEIEGDASGVDEATAEVEERLQAIEEQLEKTTEAAEEANEKLGGIGSKMNLGMAVKAVKAAAHAIKELGAFVIESARAAAEAGNGPMKKFVSNIDQLHSAFQKVGAQAASQLAPVLQQITDHFTKSTTAANALKEAGNFIANIFRVVASVGIAVVAVFDAVGTAIAGVASMIVDVLSGNMGAAAESWKVLGEEMEKVLTRAGDRFAAVWQQGQDFAGDIPSGPKKTGLSGEEKVQLAESVFANEKVAIEESVDQRKKEIEAIGDVNKQYEIATRGYESVGEALEDFERISKTAAEERYKAVQAEAAGRFMEAEQLKMSAAIHDESAQKVLGAAEALAAGIEANRNTIEGALSALGGSILQAVPRLNELVSAAQQGASVGGVWGALIAVIVQLMSETEGFQQIIAHVNASLDKVLSALEPLVSGLATLFDSTSSVTDAFMSTLKGPLETIGELLKSISPILKAFDDVLQVVSDGLDGVMGFMKTAAQPIFKILQLIGTVLKVIAPLLQILMLPLELLGILFDELTKALEPAFKEIDKAISWLANRLDEFGDFVATLGERMENFVKGKGFKSHAEVNGSSSNSTPESRAVTDPNEGLISEETRATEEATDATKEFTKAAVAATEQLLNVPAGYRVAVQRFQQQQELGALQVQMISGQLLAALIGSLTVPHMAEGGIVTGPTLALIGERGPEAVVPLSDGAAGGAGMNFYGDITIVANDPEAFERKMRRKMYARKGTGFRGRD